MKEWFDCPQYITALLEDIRYTIEILYWNKFQEEYQDNPFSNSGNVEGYKNSTFEVHAYNWVKEDQPYNFKCGDIEISWYKYLGRGMMINKEISEKEAVEMYDNCLASLDVWNNQYEKNA